MHPTEKDNIIVWNARKKGWYEVWYCKFNDPARNLAVWLRYTLHIPVEGMGEPIGELWAIMFEKGNPSFNCAFKKSFPMEEVEYSRDYFMLKIHESTISHTGLRGSIGDPKTDGISWDLKIAPAETTFRHLPAEIMYRAPLPKTKVVSPNLSCRMTGSITAKNQVFNFDHVPGHQSHIWGTKHANRWAWANCNIFQNAQNAVLEALSARVRVKNTVLPSVTVLLVRYDNKELTFNTFKDLSSPLQTNFDVHKWILEAEDSNHIVKVFITSNPADMVGVHYKDPDGEAKYCHNTNVADVRVHIYKKSLLDTELVRELIASGTCAYEVATPEPSSEVRILI